MKTIIFDIDGVLAYFPTAFKKQAATLGKDPETVVMGGGPPIPGTDADYTGDMDVWNSIIKSSSFWLTLEPLITASEFQRIAIINKLARVYFVTNRVGTRVKQQTELWLQTYLGTGNPVAVLISPQKGLAASVLDADFHIDDRIVNAHDVVVRSRNTISCLLTNPRNLTQRTPDGVIRVSSVVEFLDMVEAVLVVK